MSSAHAIRDRELLAETLELAQRAFGQTSPNPHVGSLVVRDGAVIGRAFHSRAGEPHAETLALRAAGESASGATLFVNLEPCCHHGRTPPCTRAIIAAGVARVVACHVDPNPLVLGKGFAELRAAGVTVDVGGLRPEAMAINETYVCAMVRKRPFGIMKAAATLDGKLAAAGGASRYVTGPWSRELAHRLRSTADAVAVGLTTVLRDDPDLRAPAGPDVAKRPARVVFDSLLRTPPAARLLTTAATDPVYVVGTQTAPEDRARALASRGATILRVAANAAGRVELREALAMLLSRGIQSVIYEGGGTLHAALLEARLVDRLMLFSAPTMLGGSQGTGLVERETPASMAEAHVARARHTFRIGPDQLLVADLADPIELPA